MESTAINQLSSELSSPNLPRVYCAGPLFNQSERQEMTEIADVLTAAGFPVFLPHRDGMEFRNIHRLLLDNGHDASQSAQFLHAAIFALDVYQLAEACDAMVWNLNGRVPDEGAVSEAAITWTLGKPLIAYSDDVRSLISGRMNPLLVGLVDFTTVETVSAIPLALKKEIAAFESNHSSRPLPVKLENVLHDGRALWNAMSDQHANSEDAQIADIVTQLFN